MTPVMFVSKNQNVQADFYIESDAEEIYMPDHTMSKRRASNLKKRYGSLTSYDVPDDDDNIVGYSKY